MFRTNQNQTLVLHRVLQLYSIKLKISPSTVELLMQSMVICIRRPTSTNPAHAISAVYSRIITRTGLCLTMKGILKIPSRKLGMFIIQQHQELLLLKASDGATTEPCQPRTSKSSRKPNGKRRWTITRFTYEIFHHVIHHVIHHVYQHYLPTIVSYPMSWMLYWVPQTQYFTTPW